MYVTFLNVEIDIFNNAFGFQISLSFSILKLIILMMLLGFKYFLNFHEVDKE